MVNAGHNPDFLVTASGPPSACSPAELTKSRRSPSTKAAKCSSTPTASPKSSRAKKSSAKTVSSTYSVRPPPTVFLDHVWQTLTHFAGNAKQTDDMTALYLHRAAKEVLS